MSEQQETQWTPEEQHALDFPAENLTGFDYDDITIWGTKTNPADLTPEEVTKMWFVVQRYRRELVEEGARTDAELAALRAWQRDGTIAVTGDGRRGRVARGAVSEWEDEMVTIEEIQNVFDKSGLVYVEDRDTALKPVVEQLSDGIFVGFYADPNAEWVDSEKLGNTPEEALVRAKELVAD